MLLTLVKRKEASLILTVCLILQKGEEGFALADDTVFCPEYFTKIGADPHYKQLLFLMFSHETFKERGYCQVSIASFAGYCMCMHLRI